MRYGESMFMLALESSHILPDQVQARLERHLGLLQAANPQMQISSSQYGNTLLLHDAASPFADLVETEGGFELVGGFSADNGIGEFARIALRADGNRKVLVGETDRYASWPLYFASSRSANVVSNDPHAIALALELTELNESSVYQMVTLQFVLNRCTTIDGVNRLWQGERVTFGADAIVERCQAPFLFGNRVVRGTEDLDAHLSETYANLVRSIPAYRLSEGDVVTTLSGGLDSRLVAGAMRDAGILDGSTLTFNLSASDEGEVGRQIAERLGYAHTSFDLPGFGSDVMQEAWLLTGGQKPVHAAADNLSIMRVALAERSHVRVVTATVGDPLDGSLVPQFSDFTEASKTRSCGEYWLRALSSNRAAVEGFGRAKAARRHLRELREILRDRFAEADGETAAEKLTFFDYTRRGPVFSHITTSKLSTNVLEMQPALAPAYVENFYQIRPTDLAQRNFYRRLIWQMLPGLQDVVYHNTAKHISPEYSNPGPMSWKLRMLLALPLAVQRVTDSLAARMREPAPAQVPLETAHYQALMDPELNRAVALTEALTFTPGNVTAGAFQRANTSAAVLACLWTKQYIQNERV